MAHSNCCCRRIIGLLNATDNEPCAAHDPFRRSAYDALMPHVRSMMRRAVRRLHTDPRKACLRAGLAPTEDALFELDMIYITRRLPKIRTGRSSRAQPRPIWLAAKCASLETQPEDDEIVAAGHPYHVSTGRAELVAYRLPHKAFPRLVRHVAICLCAESHDPAIASAVDQMLVADRLAA